eukprot:g10698.t1
MDSSITVTEHDGEAANSDTHLRLPCSAALSCRVNNLLPSARFRGRPLTAGVVPGAGIPMDTAPVAVSAPALVSGAAGRGDTDDGQQQ